MTDRRQAEPRESARVAAGAVVIDALERVLLVRRGRPPGEGEWSLPGGHVEEGETPEAAALRELREETAVEGRLVASLGVVEIAREHARFSIHEFLIAPTTHEPPHAGDDAADARWVRVDTLRSMGVRADAIAIVELGLARYRAHGPAEPT